MDELRIEHADGSRVLTLRETGVREPGDRAMLTVGNQIDCTCIDIKLTRAQAKALGQSLLVFEQEAAAK